MTFSISLQVRPVREASVRTQAFKVLLQTEASHLVLALTLHAAHVISDVAHALHDLLVLSQSYRQYHFEFKLIK